MTGLAVLAVALASALSDAPLVGGDRASLASASCGSAAGATSPLLDQGLEATGGEVGPVPAQVRRAVDDGASIVSVTASWRALRVDPSVPYDWDTLDETIDVARAAGLRVRLQLVGMPAWAATRTAPAGEWRPPLTDAELAAWSGFVADLAQHVRGRVDYYEVWNEPNAATYWSSGPDPRAYAALLRATYAVVKRIDPDVVVVTGGLRRNDLAFLSGLYRVLDESAGPARPFDMVGLHPVDAAPLSADGGPVWPYDRQPFGLDAGNVVDLRAVHALMRAHGDGAKQLYVGELVDPRDTALPELAERWSGTGCSPYVFAVAASPRPAVPPGRSPFTFFSD